MTQYAVRFAIIYAGDYWIPAFAGMTAMLGGGFPDMAFLSLALSRGG